MLDKNDVAQVMNQLKVELTGVSDAALRAMMFDVMTEFFNDSSAWLEAIQMTTIAGINEYDITPTDGQIIRLAGIIRADNTVVSALMPTPGHIVAKSAPNTAETWYVNVVKNVVLPVTKDQLPNAPDWTLRLWHNVIKEGVLGNMMNQKGKSWADAKGAAYHLARFRKGIVDARVATLKANTAGAQAWRFPQGFKATSQKGGVPFFNGGNS